MTARSTRTRIWVAGGIAYVATYAAVAWWYLADPDLPVDEKVVAVVGVAVLPAVAFVIGSLLLLRRSRNVVALVAAAVTTALAAFAQLLLTFGISIPLSVVLLAVAVAAANRAAAIGGKSRRDRLLLIGGALVLCFLAPAVTWQFAVVGLALLLALLAWRVVRG